LKSASLQYANALADIALAQAAAGPTAKQLSDFCAAYAQSAELRTFLGSPAVPIEAKHAVIEKLIARSSCRKSSPHFNN
jgi:F0F1-type ATP synthase delta subunit